MLMAMRSAASRTWRLVELISGMERRRPSRGLDIAPFPRLLFGGFKILFYARILLKVGRDELRRLFPRQFRGLFQSILAHAVDNAEVDRLGHPAHIRSYLRRLNTEESGGGGGMNILIAPEGLKQALVLRQMGQHPQVNLRVIGAQQEGAGRGNESLPDLPAQVAAHRDILQVRVAGGEATGSRSGLIEAGVHPSGLVIEQAGQGINVG